MKRIVVLISGRGSNLQAIAQACVSEGWNAQIAGVVSNRPDAAGLHFAHSRAIPTLVVDHRQAGGDRAVFDAALADAVASFQPDVIALAGFMRILAADFVERYSGRLVNIHPSLLPAFTGLHTHRRAIEAGCKLAGATVHFVTPQLDHGPIIGQAVVPVLPGDSEETLSLRVLAKEHVLYPKALRWLIDGALRIDGFRVTQLRGEAQLML